MDRGALSIGTKNKDVYDVILKDDKDSTVKKGWKGVENMNRVQHFLVPVEDMERAQKFYESVFQWDIKDTKDLYDNYHFAKTVDEKERHNPDDLYAINGGLFKKGNHGLDNITIVIEVGSIDPYLKRAQDLGCKVVLPKTSVSETGFYAQITDTEDNIIGLWEKKVSA